MECPNCKSTSVNVLCTKYEGHKIRKQLKCSKCSTVWYKITTADVYNDKGKIVKIIPDY